MTRFPRRLCKIWKTSTVGRKSARLLESSALRGRARAPDQAFGVVDRANRGYRRTCRPRAMADMEALFAEMRKAQTGGRDFAAEARAAAGASDDSEPDSEDTGSEEDASANEHLPLGRWTRR